MKSRLSESQGMNIGAGNISCCCGYRLTTCSGCRNKPRQQVQHGGTIGYRPPEVIMRHAEQTTALDVWAVGIILGIFLTGRFPFLRAEDDLEVFYGLVFFLSLEKMQAAARHVGRFIVVNPKPKPLVGEHVQWLQARCNFIRQNTPRATKPGLEGSPSALAPVQPSHEWDESVYDLLSHLLDPNFATRFTCQEALNHSFFRTTNKS